MILTLMHKRLPVADLEYDEAGGAFTKILQVYHLEHFPVGIVHKSIVDRGSLNRWWRDRAIPATRAGIRDALEKLSVSSSEELLEKCYGLSLSDQYWIQPQDLKLSWDQVNFFDNPFSPDVGNVLLGQHPSGKLSLMSPDNSSDGWLKKRWTILDGKRYLVKGGSGTVQQEPYNEVMASRIMERLGIPHVHYDLTVQNGLPYSVCEDFITRDTELVPAHRLVQTQKQLNSRSDYQHFLLCCQCCGIPDPTAFLDRMMTVDYLMANVDRHYNNFGAIRDAESLKYLGMAPIYDNGTSLWYDTPTAMIDAEADDIPARPFKGTQGQQIQLVTSFDWIKPDALYGLGDELHDILKDAPTIDIQRRDVLCRALEQRSKLLLQEVQSRGLQCVVPSESLSASSSTGVYDIPLLQQLITPVAQQYQLPVVYLFGSYARGTANEDSDIDLLIEARGSKIRSLLDLGALHQELTRILGKEVDLITVRSLEQSSTVPSDAAFSSSVLSERVCLYNETSPTEDLEPEL